MNTGIEIIKYTFDCLNTKPRTRKKKRMVGEGKEEARIVILK